MSIYNELMIRIWRAYRDASNGFRPPQAQAKIDAALSAFEKPFQDVAAQIERRRSGLYPDRAAYLSETGDTLRVLDADLAVLKAAAAAAARADKEKVAKIIVDQAAAARKAKQQQAADGDMIEQIDKLIALARQDAEAAGEIPYGPPP